MVELGDVYEGPVRDGSPRVVVLGLFNLWGRHGEKVAVVLDQSRDYTYAIDTTDLESKYTRLGAI